MSFTYSIERNPDLLVIIGEGIVSQAERISFLRTMMTDPAYTPGLNTLCDLTQSETTPTMAELHGLVEVMMHHANAMGRKKIAIVTSKPMTYGVARQFASFAAPMALDIDVFSSREAALRWLFSTT